MLLLQIYVGCNYSYSIKNKCIFALTPHWAKQSFSNKSIRYCSSVYLHILPTSRAFLTLLLLFSNQWKTVDEVNRLTTWNGILSRDSEAILLRENYHFAITILFQCLKVIFKCILHSVFWLAKNVSTCFDIRMTRDRPSVLVKIKNLTYRGFYNCSNSPLTFYLSVKQ